MTGRRTLRLLPLPAPSKVYAVAAELERRARGYRAGDRRRELGVDLARRVEQHGDRRVAA